MDKTKTKIKKRKYVTKRQRIKLKLWIIAMLSIVPACAIMYIQQKTTVEILRNALYEPLLARAEEPEDVVVKAYRVIEEQERQITAYNAGDPNQTDGSPCISASGDNICNLLARGQKICAANFVPLGTWLQIEDWGECIVLDRMARRFGDRVDVAMEAHEKAEALKFNKWLNVRVLER